MHEDTERVAAQGLNPVHQAHGKAGIPGLAGIRERKSLLTAPGRGGEKRAKIGIAADDTIEGDDIGGRQVRGNVGEIRLAELDAVRVAAAGGLALRGAQVGAGGIDVSGAGDAVLEELVVDGPYAAADVEQG